MARYKDNHTGNIIEAWQWNGQRIAQYENNIPKWVFSSNKKGELILTSKNTLITSKGAEIGAGGYINANLLDTYTEFYANCYFEPY